MSEIQDTHVNSTPRKSRLPVMAIPAIIVLALMLAVFVVTVYLSTHKVNMLSGLFGGEYIGDNYFRRAETAPELLRNSILTTLLSLAVCGVISAGMCALYRLMKKPGAVLWVACLWLIPVVLPSAVIAMPVSWRVISLTHVRSDMLVYVLTTGIQTLGVFCFTSGLFAYLKKSPFTGLLTAILIALLCSLSQTMLAPSFALPGSETTPMDFEIFRAATYNNQISYASALTVIKVLVQVLIGIVPAILLCRMHRPSSAIETAEKGTRAEFLLLPAVLVSGLLALLYGPVKAIQNVWIRMSLVNVLLALAGGTLCALVGWSMIRLLRRTSSLPTFVIILVFSAGLSCFITQRLMSTYTLRAYGSMSPQILLAPFDRRMVMIVLALAFAFRFRSSVRPLWIILSLALLAGALAWGDLTLALLYGTPTVSNMFKTVITSSDPAVAWAQTPLTLLLLLPPLALGTCSALSMRKAWSD